MSTLGMENSNKQHIEIISDEDEEITNITPRKRKLNRVVEDDEDSKQYETPERIPPEEQPKASSSVRRSGRIARTESLKSNSASKKMKFRSLETSLDGLADSRPQITRNGEHLNDFVVPDDEEIEYWDDKQDNAIDIDDSEIDEDHQEGDYVDEEEEMNLFHAMTSSKDPKEWFDIFLRYLAACIQDEYTPSLVNRGQGVVEYVLFRKSAGHIEKELTARRDTIRTATAWNDQIVYWLQRLPYYSAYDEGFSDKDCEVCGKANHPATIQVVLEGIPCDASEINKNLSWPSVLRKCQEEGTWIKKVFFAGSTCYARTLIYSELSHAQRNWVDLLRQSIYEGKEIWKEERFVKIEFKRYRRLFQQVDSFSTDGRGCKPHSEWERLSNSLFALYSRAHGNIKRDDIEESFILEHSDEEGTEDDQEFVESDAPCEHESGEEAEFDPSSRSGAAESTSQQLSEDDILTPPNKDIIQQPRKRKSRVIQDEDDEDDDNETCAEEAVSDAKAAGESRPLVPVTDLPDEDRCLICHKRGLTGCVVHGNYCHVYCCYSCGKEQLENGTPCLVCGQSVEYVFNILPLTAASRRKVGRYYPAPANKS